MSKNEIVTAEVVSSEVVTMNLGGQLPAHLADTKGKGSGLTGLTADDIVIPRIKLLQGISQEVKDGLPGAEAGVFWLNVLDVPLGTNLDFVVINNRIRVLLLAPREDGQGILARSDDGVNWDHTGEWNVKIKNVRQAQKWAITDLNVAKSGLLNFGTSVNDDPDSNPAATRFFDYLVYLPKFDLIAVLSLARSQAKKAKDLNGKIELSNVDMNGLLLQAGVITDTNGTDSFANYRFVLNGYTDEPTYNYVKGLQKQYKTFRVADEIGDDATSASSGGTATSSEF